MERTPVMKRSCSTSPIYHKSSSYLRDKDASFSSYLKPNHEPINFADQENQNPSPKIDESTEISIFDAQKYFNESTIIDSQKVTTIITTTTNSCKVSPLNNIAITNDVIEESLSSQFGLSGIPRFSSAASSIDGYSNINNMNQRASSFHAANTPTASSEASWNSQTGLLSNPPGFIPVSVQNTVESRTNKDSSLSFSRAKWFSFRKKCPCPCTGKKSVQVKEKSIQRTKIATTNQHSASVSATEDSGTFQNETPRASLNHKGQNQSKLTKSSSIVEMSQMRIQDKERASYKSTVLKPQEFRTDWSQRNQLLSEVSKETEQSKLQVQVLDQFLLAKGRAMFNDGLRSTTSTTGFTFPILNREETNTGKSLSSSTSFSAKVALSSSSAIIDQPRDSLEVFEPTYESKSTDNSSRISNEFIKDQSHQSNFTFKATSPKSMVMVNNDIDDVASDASSDLFEIESFSTSQTTTTTTNPNPTTYPSMFLYHNSQCRHSLDDTYSNSSLQRRFGTNGEMDLYSRRSLDEPMTLSTEYCYEPSEASIDWSVTTAEGFDRSSCVSIDHFVTDDQLISEKNKVKRISSGNNIGLLMSCRSEKAISVGPKPVKVVHNTTSFTGGGGGESGQKRDPISSEESTSSSTLGMWVVGQPNVNKPPLPRSHSARLSFPFTRS